MTVRECLTRARARLKAAGFDLADARLDARVILQHVLGRDAAWLLAHDDHRPTTTQVERIEAAVARRALHEPVAYITGIREFYGRDFVVSPVVLIPRPETELIVEAFIEAFPDRTQPLTVADVGTGSGCLAVSIACEYPQVRVMATDISEPALALAQSNAARHGVAGRIVFRLASLIPDDLAGLDAVVSNPPYVSVHDHDALAPSVRDFEPHQALFAGRTGLDVIEPLLDATTRALAPGGWLGMEIGAGQAASVMRLAAREGFTDARMLKDLAGIERTLVARRPA